MSKTAEILRPMIHLHFVLYVLNTVKKYPKSSSLLVDCERILSLKSDGGFSLFFILSKYYYYKFLSLFHVIRRYEDFFILV